MEEDRLVHDPASFHLFVIHRWVQRDTASGFFLTLIAAGIVVSYIALNPDTSSALLKKGNCGIISNNAEAAALQSLSNTTIVASAYVRDCYSKDSTGAVACNTFNKPTLPYTMVLNGSCPLGDGNCETGDNRAVNLTAILDSHDDLGINAKKSDRIQMGYSAICAPLSYSVLDAHTDTSHRYDLNSDNGSYTYSSVNVARNYTGWGYSNITTWGILNLGVYQLFPYKTYWPHNESLLSGFAETTLQPKQQRYHRRPHKHQRHGISRPQHRSNLRNIPQQNPSRTQLRHPLRARTPSQRHRLPRRLAILQRPLTVLTLGTHPILRPQLHRTAKHHPTL